MSAALWNGFPFIYPDVGTYLGSGFMPEMPRDRPITYGIFLYITSFGGLSLWLPIFFQAFITAYILDLTFDFLFKKNYNPFLYLFLILILTCTTSLPFVIGQLMTDFSTPVMALCGLLILAQHPLSIFDRRMVISLFFLTNAMHISHILLNCIVIIGLLLICAFQENFQKTFFKKHFYTLILITALGVLTMLPPLSKSSHVFRMGNLVHNNILQTYLKEKCTTNAFRLCAYKDSIPQNFDDFVWRDSPLNKIGWKESKMEFNAIITDIYTTPKYLKMVLNASAKNTIQQLQLTNICEGNIAYATHEPFLEPIETYFRSWSQYKKSRQFMEGTQLINPYWHVFHKSIILGSIATILFLGVLLYKKQVLTLSYLFFIVGLILYIFINAWLSATFSYANNRFGSKMIWLLPFLAYVFLVRYAISSKYIQYFFKKKTN
jgi:hypothetical protein